MTNKDKKLFCKDIKYNNNDDSGGKKEGEGKEEGCNYEINGNTEDEVYQNAIDHAKKEHDLRPEDMTPRLEEKIRTMLGNIK